MNNYNLPRAPTSSSQISPSTPSPVANFQPGHRPMNSVDLAKQYEQDMHKITRSVFKEMDPNGVRLEKYLSHVRIIEDAKSASSRPPANSPPSNKKNRFLILSVKSSGRMRLHKAKESGSGVIQIGRTWDFDEMTSLELDSEVPTGFICQMTKKYYWETHSPKERRVWLTTLLEHYIKYTNGKLPNLVNCTVDYFHLETLYASYQISGAASSSPVVSQRMGSPQTNSYGNRTPNLSHSRTTSQTGMVSPHRSPMKSNDLTSLKKDLGSISRSSSGARIAATNATSAALTGGMLRSPSKDTNGKMDNVNIFRRSPSLQQSTEQSKQQDQDKFAKLEAERQAKLEQDRLEQLAKIEKERQLKLEKEKRMKVEREKLDNLEREKQIEMEKKRQVQLEQRRKQEEEDRNRIVEQQKQLELQRRAEIETMQKERQRIMDIQNANNSFNSFEVGDDTSAHKDYHDDFMDDYNDEDDSQEQSTAPLQLNLPKSRERSVPVATPPTSTFPVSSTTPTNGQFASKRTLTNPKIQTDDAPNFDNPLDDNLNLEKKIDSLVTPMDKLDSFSSDINSLMFHNRPHSRSRAFSRVKDDKKDGDLLELFEEVGYNPMTDDSLALEKKLLEELEKLQYEKINSLSEVTDVVSSLKSSITAAVSSCDQINPILSFFGIQLSGFKDDVEFVENQGHNLQVEATNKKLLKKELNDIVHSVDISEDKLQMLLSSKIVVGYQNEKLESIAQELYQSLLKIRGSDGDENSQISKMKALQEKKLKFEQARMQFVTLLKSSCKRIFESISLSLSTKLKGVNSFTFESDFFRPVLINKMSSLITLNGMLAFVKQIARDDYENILTLFCQTFKTFFDNLCNVLLQDLTEKVNAMDLSSFSFNSLPKDLIDKNFIDSKTKSSSSNLGDKKNGSRILEELGFKTPDSVVDVSVVQSESDEVKVIHLVKTFCSQILKVMAMEQELIISVFSISSSPSTQFEKIVKLPMATRCEEFMNRMEFINGSIETDREISDSIFEVMSQLFDSTFSSTLKVLLSLAKRDMLQSPAIILILQSFSSIVATTNQEFIYGNFTKLESKVDNLWNREIEQQVQEITAQNVEYRVMNYTKCYPIFFFKIFSIINSLKLENIREFSAYQQLEGNYNTIWNAIQLSLNKGIENMGSSNDVTPDGLSPTASLNETNSSSISNDVILKHLILMLNYKWLVEGTKYLETLPKDIEKSMDDMRDKELALYAELIAKKHAIGKLINFLDDIKGLIQTNTDPSKTNTYSVSSMKRLLALFEGNNLKQTIKDVSGDVKAQIEGRCYYSNDLSKENKYSIEFGKNIEKDAFNNCMNSLSQVYNSNFSKLTPILRQFYKEINNPVDKIVINYNFNKEYIS